MIATIDDLRLEQFLRNRNSGILVWKDKAGSIIPIKDLTDEHINNIIRASTRAYAQSTSIKPSSLNFY